MPKVAVLLLVLFVAGIPVQASAWCWFGPLWNDAAEREAAKTLRLEKWAVRARFGRSVSVLEAERAVQADRMLDMLDTHDPNVTADHFAPLFRRVYLAAYILKENIEREGELAKIIKKLSAKDGDGITEFAKLIEKFESRKYREKNVQRALDSSDFDRLLAWAQRLQKQSGKLSVKQTVVLNLWYERWRAAQSMLKNCADLEKSDNAKTKALEEEEDEEQKLKITASFARSHKNAGFISTYLLTPKHLLKTFFATKRIPEEKREGVTDDADIRKMMLEYPNPNPALTHAGPRAALRRQMAKDAIAFFLSLSPSGATADFLDSLAGKMGINSPQLRAFLQAINIGRDDYYYAVDIQRLRRGVWDDEKLYETVLILNDADNHFLFAFARRRDARKQFDRVMKMAEKNKERDPDFYRRITLAYAAKGSAKGASWHQVTASNVIRRFFDLALFLALAELGRRYLPDSRQWISQWTSLANTPPTTTPSNNPTSSPSNNEEGPPPPSKEEEKEIDKLLDDVAQLILYMEQDPEGKELLEKARLSGRAA